MSKKRVKKLIKKKSKVDLYIAKVFKKVGSSNEGLKYIEIFKYDNSYGDILELYKKLPKIYSEYINTDLLPSTIDKVNRGIFGFYDKNTEANLNGMLALFNIHYEKINLFLKQKENFEKNFLLGNYNLSTKTLNQTINKISYSNWFIYHNFLVKEYDEGFQANFTFLKELLETGSHHPLNGIFAFCFSRMVEKDLTISNYQNYLKTEIYKPYNIYTEIKKFIEAYIDPFEIYFYEDINGIFIGEEGSPLIDKYLIFRKLLINLVFNNKNLALKIITRALKFIDDPKLLKIYFYLTNDLSFYENTTENQKTYLILDLYTEGKYKECISLSKEYILNHNISIDIIEIYLKSYINLNRKFEKINNIDSILNNVLFNIYNVLKKNSLTTESLNNLYNMVFSLHNFDLAIQLKYFINKTKNTKDVKNNDFYKKIYLIYLPTITPKIIYEFENSNTKENILNTLYEKNDNIKTINFFKQLLNFEKNNKINIDNLNIPKSRLVLHKSKILFNKNSFDSVIKNLESMLSEIKNIPHAYEECLVRLYNSYSMLDNVRQCIDLYVNNYFFNKYLLDNINTQKEIDFISDDGYKKLDIDIDLILFLHICKANSKITSLVYRIFMRNINTKKPTDININLFEHQKIIHFLRFICVQDILSKDVLNFRTSKDVELERVKICQLLLSLDEENSDIYNNEIIEITQNIKIKERMREVDNSKIYVDINGLINFDLKDFDKSFSRFKKIKDLSDKSYEELFVLIHENNEQDFENQHNYKKKYLKHEDQLYKVFIELFIEIRNKYLFSNEHGLDSYLSTRIRHGTITGQLRKTFSDLKLITTKDSETNIYLDNEYWIKELNIKDKKTFNSVMNKFSSDIDNYITLIKNKFIQVNIDNNTNAFFNFSIYALLNLLNNEFYNFFKECDTNDKFISRSIEVCEYITEENLKYIKTFFKEKIEKHFLDLLEGLEKKIHNLNIDKKHQLLSKIRHCKTDIQNTVDTVSSWFERKKKKEVDFILKDVIDTSREVINNLFSSINLNINYNYNFDKEQRFKGAYFISFVDCFKIFLENIVNYTREKNNIQTDVSISVVEHDNYIICKISNELINPTKDELNEINKKISNKAKEIKEATRSIANRQEGNSGIVKATKILKIAFKNEKNELIFNREGNNIIIEIKVFKKGLIYENTNS